MLSINSNNIGHELKRWFSKTILLFDNINFDDADAFSKILPQFYLDYLRYYPNDEEMYLENVLMRAELQGILMYRVARYYFENNNEPVAAKYSLLGRYLSAFEIYYSAKIGKSFKVNHGIGMVIGARCEVGDNALFHQGVTLGAIDRLNPVLGNNVVVYAGAKILGEIKVGNNSIVAANSVCLVNVPENSVAVGVPARIIIKK